MNSTTVTTLCNFVSPQIQECCVWDHINGCGCVWSIRQISGETNWESWACLPGTCVCVATKCAQSVNLWGLCGLQPIDIDSMHIQVVGWAWATPTLACWMLSFFCMLPTGPYVVADSASHLYCAPLATTCTYCPHWTSSETRLSDTDRWRGKGWPLRLGMKSHCIALPTCCYLTQARPAMFRIFVMPIRVPVRLHVVEKMTHMSIYHLEHK